MYVPTVVLYTEPLLNERSDLDIVRRRPLNGSSSRLVAVLSSSLLAVKTSSSYVEASEYDCKKACPTNHT
jgi:hypothetical protein